METGSPQSFNRYAYVNNDPVNKVDPLGLMLSDIGVVQVDSAGMASRVAFLSVHNFNYSTNGNYRRAWDRRQREGQQGGTAERSVAAFGRGIGAGSRASFTNNFFGGANGNEAESLPTASTQVDQCLALVPLLPEDINIDHIDKHVANARGVFAGNMEMFGGDGPATQRWAATWATLSWFKNEMRSGADAPHDYKRKYGEDYQDLGNFMFGAIGRAIGLSPGALHRAAGLVQEDTLTARGERVGGWHAIFSSKGVAPYGDSERDYLWVGLGIRYYDCRRFNRR